jgi:hypothetical protein
MKKQQRRRAIRISSRSETKPETAASKPEAITSTDYPDGLSIEEIVAKRESGKKSASE